MNLTIPEYNPNSVVVIGDVHGWTKSYQKFVQRLPEGQRSVQIGDMGIGFRGVGLQDMPEQHKWFRGNHDNPEKCRKYKSYLGDYGYDKETGIFWLAGAFSIDRGMRTMGVDYWIDEELGYAELEKAIHLFDSVRPRFVLSHEAPSVASKTLLYSLVGAYFAEKGACASSRTSEAMQVMLDKHQPEEWVFGHYHVKKSFNIPNCKTLFTCVGAQMSSGDTPQYYVLDLGARC
jgi:hypothetical protein